jgi:hypothetical protein
MTRKKTMKTGTTGDAIAVETILHTLIQAVREKYSRDPTSPGVILSEVGPSGEIYASVVRYHARFAEQKEVVVSVKAQTLTEAVLELSKRWVRSGKACERLHSLIGS